jgi:hypothetical protein
MTQTDVDAANGDDKKDTPWKIIKNSRTGNVEGYVCGRLGCHTDKLVPINSPHSALVLMVCPPCRWAEHRWDEMQTAKASKIRSIKLPDNVLVGRE